MNPDKTFGAGRVVGCWWRVVLPVTEDVMFRWRVLMEEGRKTGHTFSQPDLIIAATAMQHGLTVVTRDRGDFDKAGVPMLNPWE